MVWDTCRCNVLLLFLSTVCKCTTCGGEVSLKRDLRGGRPAGRKRGWQTWKEVEAGSLERSIPGRILFTYSPRRHLSSLSVQSTQRSPLYDRRLSL
jgi:hypothetical protein